MVGFFFIFFLLGANLIALSILAIAKFDILKAVLVLFFFALIVFCLSYAIVQVIRKVFSIIKKILLFFFPIVTAILKATKPFWFLFKPYYSFFQKKLNPIVENIKEAVGSFTSFFTNIYKKINGYYNIALEKYDVFISKVSKKNDDFVDKISEKVVSEPANIKEILTNNSRVPAKKK